MLRPTVLRAIILVSDRKTKIVPKKYNSFFQVHLIKLLHMVLDWKHCVNK